MANVQIGHVLANFNYLAGILVFLTCLRLGLSHLLNEPDLTTTFKTVLTLCVVAALKLN